MNDLTKAQERLYLFANGREDAAAKALGITKRQLLKRATRQPNGRVRKPAPRRRQKLIAAQRKARPALLSPRSR